MELMLLIVLATAPALFWLWWFYRKDRLDPEPLGLVLKIFLLGMLPVLPAGLLEYVVLKAVPGASGNGIVATFIATLFVIGPIEEYGKYLVVRRWAFRNPAFNEPLDGIVYAAAAALGFAALENVFYLASEGMWLILLRGPLSTLGHVLFSACWGYALGMAWAQTDPLAARRLIRNGLIYAVLGHGTYDFLLKAGQAGSYFGLLPLLVLPLLVLLYRQVGANIRTSLASSPLQLTARPTERGPDGPR